MTRRSLWRLFLPQIQSARQTNPPRCPVCHVAIPTGAPVYAPVVSNVDAAGNVIGDWVALTNARDQFCANCGTRFVTTT